MNVFEKNEFWMGVLIVLPAVFGVGLGAKYTEVTGAGFMYVILFALAGLVLGVISYLATKKKSIQAKLGTALLLLALLIGVGNFII